MKCDGCGASAEGLELEAFTIRGVGPSLAELLERAGTSPVKHVCRACRSCVVCGELVRPDDVSPDRGAPRVGPMPAIHVRCLTESPATFEAFRRALRRYAEGTEDPEPS